MQTIPTKIAVVGCGYVADFYLSSLPYHTDLELVGVFDIDEKRLQAFANHYLVTAYPSFEALLSDQDVTIVLNLTNPRAHCDVTRACIEAGKHVYTEKPLAMTYDDGWELLELAKKRGVRISAAPCSLLGATAQTLWKALEEGAIGEARLVYANFDAGMTHKFKPWSWRSASGAFWPAKDEFEVGCTYQHAGYLITWLAAFFGPAVRVTSFAQCLLEDKEIDVDFRTPDFTVGCVEFESGVVARITNSIVALSDRSMTIYGDKGVLHTVDVRDDASPVYIKDIPPRGIEGGLEYRVNFWANKFERLINRIPWSWGRLWRFWHRVPFRIKPIIRSSGKYKPVDFCRGPAEMASAITERRPCRLSAEFALHVTEVTEAIQHPERFGGSKEILSRFSSIEPVS